MKIFALTSTLIFFYIFLFAQKQDFVWLYGRETYDIILPERAADTTKGASNLDFNYEPPKLYYDPHRLLDFSGVNSSVCDVNGAILAYTNGQVIYNQFDMPIADTINYSADWEYSNAGDKNLAIPEGILGIQMALIVPVPDDSSMYYTFYTTRDRENPPFITYKISYALFEVGNQNKNGSLIDKDKMLLKDSLSGSITAVRHGNGRDWWLIAPRRIGHTLNIWLIDPYGIHFRGRLETGLPSTKGIGQIYGSPDGKWLSWFVGNTFTETGGRLFLARFDRCAGQIYDPDFIFVDLSHYRLGNGVSFSHDSRYLYMCNEDFIYQYRLNEENILNSGKKVATYDGYEYFFSWDTAHSSGSHINFCLMGLAPDGRIYISPSSGYTRMMSVIQFPEKSGEECDVRQHSLLMPTSFFRGIPNFPTYRLGPLDGSECDTLGLDNHPVAKYRYEVDSTDHLSFYFTDLSYFRPEAWSWDFGDGSQKVYDRYPVHRFPAKGIYEVCLTVSNENSSDIVCDTINIGTLSSDHEEEYNFVEASLYPNPVVDFFQLTFGGYVPVNGSLEIINLSAKTIRKQRLYYGQNIVNMTSVPPGNYFCILRDGMTVIKSMKVVKL